MTTTSEKYASSFGFTEKEVFRALELMGKADQKEEVKLWYDGFTFGKHTDIYNPWSIIKFLDTGELNTYWASTSENSLVSKLIREGSPQLKMDFEDLLEGKTVNFRMDEQIVFEQLQKKKRRNLEPSSCQRLSEGREKDAGQEKRALFIWVKNHEL